MRLTDVEPIYNKIAELEDLARTLVLDTPTNSPDYIRYLSQLNERTNLKHMLFDAPTIAPSSLVKRGRWERVIPTKSAAKWSTKVCCSCCRASGYTRFKYCPNCGAKMEDA